MAGVKGRSGGRTAKTVDQHHLEGTFDARRHAGYTNPSAPKGTPELPKALDGEALAEWHRMVERLATTGALSIVDDAALYQYCRLYAETEAIAQTQAETAASIEVLEENIGTITRADPTQLVALFQEITKLRALEARYTTQVRQGRLGIRVFLVEFGMTPAARSRVKLPDQPKPADPFEAMQKRAALFEALHNRAAPRAV